MTSLKPFPTCAVGRHAAAFAALFGGLLAAAPAWGDPAQSSGATHLEASGNQVQGALQINQDAGASNNQGNMLVVAAASDDGSAALARVIAETEQGALGAAAVPALQSNAITDSFNNTSGVVQVNQTTGRGNTELNILALAFAGSSEFSPALTDVDLRSVAGPGPSAEDSSALAGSANTLDNSFNNFRGVAQIQQIAGDRNVVVSVVAIAFGGAGG